jgi:hypothetical protein
VTSLAVATDTPKIVPMTPKAEELSPRVPMVMSLSHAFMTLGIRELRLPPPLTPPEDEATEYDVDVYPIICRFDVSSSVPPPSTVASEPSSVQSSQSGKFTSRAVLADPAAVRMLLELKEIP